MERVGSQIRCDMKKEGYSLLKRIGEEVVLENEEGGQELWVKRDDFAGFVMVIDGIGYEFVRSF